MMPTAVLGFVRQRELSILPPPRTFQDKKGQKEGYMNMGHNA